MPELPVYQWKFEKNPKFGGPVNYRYWIDLDERGEFRATVYNSRDRAVFNINGFDIFEDGFMKHKHDIQGLEEYLKTLKIMPPASRLVESGDLVNPLTPAEKKNVLAEAKVHRKLTGPYYQGMAAGMQDIAEEYAKTKGTNLGLRAARLRSHLAMLNPKYGKSQDVKVGDRVGYSKQFLKSTSTYTGPIPFAKGVIKSITENGIADVDWDNKEVPRFVHVFNLARVGSLKWQGNPVLPFRRKATSYTGKRMDPTTLDQAELYRIALTWTDDPQRAEQMVNAFIAGAAQGAKIRPKGKLFPFKSNPPMRKIYNRVLQVFASKEGMAHQCDARCRAAHHRYQHRFTQKACIYGLPDGSILIK